MTPMLRQESVVAGSPVHGWRWQADIWTGLCRWLEQPLSEVKPTKDGCWAGVLIERQLPRRANSCVDPERNW